jgi:hypothetical protein
MRYKIIEESTSGHCCFDYTVVDTSKPLILVDDAVWAQGNCETLYETVCECFEKNFAEIVCSALNKQEHGNTQFT